MTVIRRPARDRPWPSCWPSCLVISVKTASHHVEHIYAKTGTANRARASLYAARHGLIGAPDASPAPADSPSTGSAAS
jgi:hypothetical protein